jgi:hypothetical protein
MDTWVRHSQINQLIRDWARLKIEQVEAQVHQQADGKNPQIQSKVVSLEAQIEGIEAVLLRDFEMTPEKAGNRARELLGIAVPTATPESPSPASQPTQNNSPERRIMAESSNNRTIGVPTWLALVLGVLLAFVVLVFGFIAIDSMNKPGSINPANNALVASPTASASSSQSAAPSTTASDGAVLGIESPGCTNKVRWQESTQIGNTPDMDPVTGQTNTVPCDSMYRVINYWQVQSTDPAVAGDHKLLIPANTKVTLMGGGGSMWTFVYSGEALGNFQQNPNKEITLDQLVALGLATVSGESSTPSTGNTDNGTSNPPTGFNPPAPQDGCTTTNKQTTPDELVAVGSHEPLNILHRIDSFGYSGWSLTEFYTLVKDKSEYGAHRVPTIGYVGQPREALNGLVGIWFGEGSAWDYGDNGAQCNKDYALEWATFYAVSGAIEPGRLDNGNSGIVVDMESCKLYNNRPDLGWNHDNIQALLNDHLANMVTFPCQSLTDASDGSTYQVSPGARDLRGNDSALPSGPSGDGSCAQSRASENFGSNFQGRKTWHITTSGNEVAVVNFWSNWTDPNYPFVKFKLAPNSDVQLKGGGDVTFFPADCQDQVTQAMKQLAGNQKVIDFSDLPSRYKK